LMLPSSLGLSGGLAPLAISHPHQRSRNAVRAACCPRAWSDPAGAAAQRASPASSHSTRIHAWSCAQAAERTSLGPNCGPRGRPRSRAQRSTQMLCKTASRSSSHTRRRLCSTGSQGSDPKPNSAPAESGTAAPVNRAHTRRAHPHAGATAGQDTSACSSVSSEDGAPRAAQHPPAEQADASTTSASVPPPHATKRARHGNASCSNCHPKWERCRGMPAPHKAA